MSSTESATLAGREWTSRSTEQHGVLSMLTAGLESSSQRSDLRAASIVAFIVLVGFVGISGVHLGNPWREPILGLSRPTLYWGALAAAIISGFIAQSRRRYGLSALAFMSAAYLAGNFVSGVAHRVAEVDAIESPVVRFIASRLLYVAGVTLPMFLVLIAGLRDRTTVPLRFGDWKIETRLGRNDSPRSWGRIWLWFLLFIAIPMFLLMQANVGFGPLESGRLTILIPFIAAMALANAFAEELIFRGLLQGVAVRAVGPAAGVWLIAVLFGLHHWGASFAPLASLGGSALIGAGSALFGKSVIETKGLGWAVTAHALVNVALFSAYYVAT